MLDIAETIIDRRKSKRDQPRIEFGGKAGNLVGLHELGKTEPHEEFNHLVLPTCARNRPSSGLRYEPKAYAKAKPRKQ